MTAVVRPGRQRSQAADTAIVEATLDLLREVGYGALTMSAVIERAGVSSATLYRRWPTKAALVVAALQRVSAGPPPADTGSLWGDLEAFAKHLARGLARRDDLWVVLWTEIHHNQELQAMNRAFVEPRLAQLTATLERAVARGELASAPSAELVLSLLAGPIQHRVLTMGERVSPSFLRAVVDSVAAWVTTTFSGVGSTTSH